MRSEGGSKNVLSKLNRELQRLTSLEKQNVFCGHEGLSRREEGGRRLQVTCRFW